MLIPRGGGTPGICGAFDLCCLPHPWEFDWHLWVPGWGRLLFCMEEWDQVILSHVLVCALKRWPNWNLLRKSLVSLRKDGSVWTKGWRWYYHLQPLVHKLPSFVTDTNDFLNKLLTIGKLPANSLLVTLVSSLYTVLYNNQINARALIGQSLGNHL